MMIDKFTFALKHPLQTFYNLFLKIPYFYFVRETRGTQTPITFTMWFIQKILGVNRHAYWPVHCTSRIVGHNNIYSGIETCPGYMPGCYVQGIDRIYIGDYTQIGPNVGIITANHDLYDNRMHFGGQPVTIGCYCWIGMNSVILPGVQLGDFTVVGAGSIVTTSFQQGYCVIAGNPAKILKTLEKEKCIRHRSHHEYNGYVKSTAFEDFRKKHLNV